MKNKRGTNIKTEIKYNAGDEVYWLSSKGFIKGIVKQVIYVDNISNDKKNRCTEIRYWLWSPKYADAYMGDEVKEEDIFTTYEALAYYYLKKDCD